MPKVITSNATSSGGGVEYVQVNADWNATEGVSAILNKPEIPEPMTGTEILTALKTVDGSGSGLDADKLDGKESTEFSLSGHTHPNDHVPIMVSDTTSIDLTLVGQALSASVKFGTTSGTVAQGNDSRFTDARTPLAHDHNDLYFTETETTNLLSGKANSSHSHLIADLPPYPTTLPANGGTADTLEGLVPTVVELNFVDGVTSAIQGQLDLKAPTASPSFTGIPTAPTPVVGTNTTQIATTEFVQNSMANAGSGDMLKSIYDTDGNGIVDMAKNLVGDDTRSINSNPSEYMSGGSRYVGIAGGQTEFKGTATIGVTSFISGTYCYLETKTPWTDGSGGYPIQVVYGNGSPIWRVGTGLTTWGAWNNMAGDIDGGTF